MNATVTAGGAVLLGGYVACDAFHESMPLRIVTHAHADHIGGLQKSLQICEKVLMTEATKDLIAALRSPLFLMSGDVKTLDYGETLQYEDERITLLRSDHILGATQVLVEDNEGTRILYTGDFRIDETPVVDVDVLVMEATYGSPSCKRSFREDVKHLLVSLVEKGLNHGTVCVFGYHGKLQEVMQILRRAGLKAPFVMPERVFHVSKICEHHNMKLGQLVLATEEKGKELLENDSSCIAFYHMASRNNVGSDTFRLLVSGWEFGSPFREIAEKEYVVALSDHSDFDGLIEYVRIAKPKTVITDNFRAGHATILAREIRRRFGISAYALPEKQ